MDAATIKPPLRSGNPPPASRFARLNPLGPVGLNGSACLHLHKPWLACTGCRDVCSQACLQLEAGTVRLDAGRCNGCGRCAVACPTAALAVDGFALAGLAAQTTAGVLQIACRGAAAIPDGAATVPCLSGLSVRSLLGLLCLYPATSLQLLDDAGCSICGGAAGGWPSAAQRLLEGVREVLGDCGLPVERIALVSRPASLPIGNDAGLAKVPAVAGRRSFFSGLGRVASQGIVNKASGSSPRFDPAVLPKQARHAVPYSAGHETRRLMLQLAASAGGVPGRACLPQVSLAGQCCANAACSRLCPTGALRSSVLDAVRLLSFDPWLCIDCGACREACPEKALVYQAPARRDFAPGPQLLSRVEMALCSRCGDSYSPAHEAAQCPLCRKSAQLSRAGFAMFAGLRHQAPTETGPP